MPDFLVFHQCVDEPVVSLDPVNEIELSLVVEGALELLLSVDESLLSELQLVWR